MGFQRPERPDSPLTFQDKIRLDRYALKGDQNDIQAGDWVMVLTKEHPESSVKEVGIVKEVNHETHVVDIELISGDYGTVFTQDIGKVDKLLEYSWRQISHRIADSLSSVEKTPTAREAAYLEFLEQLRSGKLVPAKGFYHPSEINLAQFVKNGKVLWDDLAETVRIGVRFLDNVLDYFEENKEQKKGELRNGLGEMGFSEMLAKLDLSDGSNEALDLLNSLGKFMATRGCEASAALAVERGL